jgi:hypothetical protein
MATKLELPTPKRSPLGARHAAWFTGRIWRKVLLACGIVGPIGLVVWDVVGSLRYPGYSYVDQTISELSAQGAPTRTFTLVVSSIPYGVLMTSFGAGVWIVTGARRAGRITGAVVVAEALWGVAGGIAFPMATRAVIAAHPDTLRNQMHMWYGIGMPILLVLAVSFGSRLLDKRFRAFSYGTIAIMLMFGLVQSLQAGDLAANRATPWMGLEERITAYAPMLWYVLLAVGLLRADASRTQRQLAPPRATPPVMQ